MLSKEVRPCLQQIAQRLTVSRDQKEKGSCTQDASDIIIVESVAQCDSNGLQRQLKVRIHEN